MTDPGSGWPAPSAPAPSAPTPPRNDTSSLGVVATIEPAVLTVAAGAEAVVSVTINHLGREVDDFRITMLGEPGRWAVAQPASLGLLPGQTGTATVRFRPPRTPQTPAGEFAFGIAVTSSVRAERRVVEEGRLTVQPFADLSGTISPRTSRGRRRGRHTVYLQNNGNSPADLTLTGSDPDQLLDVGVTPNRVHLVPGQAAYAQVDVHPRQALRKISPHTPFQVDAQQYAGPAIRLDGAFNQRPWIASAVPRTVVTLLALGMAGVLTWKLAFDKKSGPAVPESTGQVTASPASVELKDCKTDAGSCTFKVVLTGDGKSTLSFRSKVDPPFSADRGNCNGQISPQQASCEITITFKPATGDMTGTQNANVLIVNADNPGGKPFAVIPIVVDEVSPSPSPSATTEAPTVSPTDTTTDTNTPTPT